MDERIQAADLGNGRYQLKGWSGSPIGPFTVLFVVAIIAGWMIYGMLTSTIDGKSPVIVAGSWFVPLYGAFSLVSLTFLFVRTWTTVEWDEQNEYLEERCLFGPAIGFWRKEQILGIALDYFLTAEKGNTRRRMPTVPTYRLILITRDGRRSHLFEHCFSDKRKALEDRGKALAEYIGVDYLGGGFEKFVYIKKGDDGSVEAELKPYSLLTWYRESEDGKLGCFATLLSLLFLFVIPFIFLLVHK